MLILWVIVIRGSLATAGFQPFGLEAASIRTPPCTPDPGRLHFRRASKKEFLLLGHWGFCRDGYITIRDGYFGMVMHSL